MKKIITISDHPLSPSGVGTQTKYFIEAMLDTGEYEVLSLAGAIQHSDYRLIVPDEYKGRWKILPVDGYGTQEMIRDILAHEKPDLLWFMTDPRFYGWLWEIEDEIRANVPMMYYHVWDNYPYPTYNKRWYDSNDVVVTISKVTDDIVRTLTEDSVEVIYHPHAVDNEFFCPKDKREAQEFKEMVYHGAPHRKEYFTFFWNSRNARRKQSGSLIFCFKELIDKLGHDRVNLIMHTDVKDVHGQDLEQIIQFLGLINGEVVFSTEKFSMQQLSLMYSFSDCTIAVSDAEGFGLSMLESLSCGTPIICTMTGGMQDQVTDGENFFGIGMEPCSKAIIGSQEIPWIYEDRLNGDVVVDSMLEMYNKSEEEMDRISKLGLKHVEDNFSFENYKKRWVEIVENTIEKHGSWDNRKNFKSWTLGEIK